MLSFMDAYSGYNQICMNPTGEQCWANLSKTGEQDVQEIDRVNHGGIRRRLASEEKGAHPASDRLKGVFCSTAPVSNETESRKMCIRCGLMKIIRFHSVRERN